MRELVQSHADGMNLEVTIPRLEGLLTALRRDWCGMRIETFPELVHAAMFTNMLDAAAYLLTEGYHGPAAVMAGAVLDQHVRRLCEKHGIATTFDKDGDTVPKKLDAMNNEVAKYYANGKQDQKEITPLAGIRNEAAHGHFDKFDARQVEGMILGIRGFINRNPA
jgi:hypothetical protein